jgi:hypothetical protein
VIRWTLLLLSLVPLGCNATCVRDSDCLGTSICTENRCILVTGAGADAGRATTPSTHTTRAPDAAATAPSSDAGTVN